MSPSVDIADRGCIMGNIGEEGMAGANGKPVVEADRQAAGWPCDTIDVIGRVGNAVGANSDTTCTKPLGSGRKLAILIGPKSGTLATSAVGKLDAEKLACLGLDLTPGGKTMQPSGAHADTLDEFVRRAIPKSAGWQRGHLAFNTYSRRNT